MAKTFTAKVDKIILKTNKRMVALVREATQELVNRAQTPVAKGGKMRVDTNFLRASGQMSLTGMPTGPVRGDADGDYDFDEATVITTLAGYKLGNSIFFGWTANYAKYREAYDGFLSSAVQDWPKIVDDIIVKIKAKIR